MSQTLDFPEVEYFIDFFESEAPFNFSAYSSPQFDELIRQTRREVSRVRRAQYYQQMNRILFDDAVTINLSHPPLVTYWNRCLERVEIGIMGEAVIDYSQIRLRAGCRERRHFE